MGTSLRDALDRMRIANRSGVVYRQKDKYWLLEAPDIVINLRRNAEDSIDTVKERREVHPANVAAIAAASPGPLMHIEDLYRDIESSGTPYGILAQNDYQVFIITAAEELHTMLASGPAGCYCTLRHGVTGCSTGDSCPTGDGGTVVCAYGR